MEGKQGTARQSRLIGTWPATGDGGRVDQLFHAGADEGDAEQVAVVLVEENAGAAGAAVGVQADPGHRLAGVDVDHAYAGPRLYAPAGRAPVVRFVASTIRLSVCLVYLQSGLGRARKGRSVSRSTVYGLKRLVAWEGAGVPGAS
jgi:hypothetical protein